MDEWVDGWVDRQVKRWVHPEAALLVKQLSGKETAWPGPLLELT